MSIKRPKPPIEAVTIPIAQPNQFTEPAIRLLAQIVPISNSVRARNVARTHVERPQVVCYGVIEASRRLVAAAVVMHARSDFSDRDTHYSAVHSCVVSASRRGQGVWWKLMKHIAGQASQVGDSLLSLYAL